MDPLQVVAEPTRREILRLVWHDERPAGEIAAHFDLTFGAVSQHLAVLREAGFVRSRREGSYRYYRADRERLGPLAPTLEAMWQLTLDGLAEAIEADQRGDHEEGDANG
jgi:DNA-binding transcriptional ArsR family regulator